MVDLDRAWAGAAFGRDGYSWRLLHSFFGIGAIFVGILAGFHIAGPVWFQVIVFSGFSLITLWLFRQRTEFGKLAQEGNTMILPATLSDVGSMISLAMNVIKQKGSNNGAPEKA
jgi:hypothetical protein